MVNNRTRNFLLLCLVDVLFLPFLKPLPITLTVVPILFWNLKNLPLIQRRRDRDGALSIAIIVLATISVGVSLVSLPESLYYNGIYFDAKSNNIKLFGLFLIFFTYLLFFREVVRANATIIRRVLLIYLGFSGLLAMVFWYDHSLFFEVRVFWTFGGEVLSTGDLSSLTRFTGTFSDPNNAAVAFVMIYATLCVGKSSVVQFLVYTVIVLLMVIATMSVTGTLSFAIAFVCLSAHNFRISGKNLSLYTSILAAVPATYFLWAATSGADVYNIFLERVSQNSGSAASRIDKVALYLSSKEFIGTFVVGSGGTIFINDIISRPHIGHLHLIFNYSIYVWILYLFVVFRVRRCISLIHYLPVFVFFIGFSANTGIIDFRFVVVAALISGIYMGAADAESGVRSRKRKRRLQDKKLSRVRQRKKCQTVRSAKKALEDQDHLLTPTLLTPKHSCIY